MPFLLSADANPGTATWSTGVVSDTATIALGANTTGPIAVGAAFDGVPVLVTTQGAAPDATATVFSASWDGAGNLTITANANATAATTVAYAVLGTV